MALTPFDANQLGSVAHRKNAMINGGFDIWQRGTSFTDAVTLAYTADRWQGYRGGFAANGTFSRIASGLDQFRFARRIQRDSGDSSTAQLFTIQTLETSDSYRFQGQKATVSFMARRGVDFTEPFHVFVFSGDGVDQAFGSMTNLTSLGGVSNSLTENWIKYSGTVDVPSTTTQLALQIFYVPTGTAGADEYADITGVQLEVGAAATDFEHRSFGEEFSACERYYAKVDDDAWSGSVLPGNTRWSKTLFRVEMRINPTIIITDGGSQGFNAGAPTFNSSTATGVLVAKVAAFTQPVGLYRYGLSMDAEL